jgi:protoporphyrinogen oxidase
MNQKSAIIIGAGPAGLTAALELIEMTDVKPIVIESSNQVGGISKTVNYKGNRIDIGGHRFFSKSDTVMNWWLKIMPLQGGHSSEKTEISYQGKTTDLQVPANGPDPDKTDLVMLIRNRLSRIFYLRKFFDYPISINSSTISNLGIVRLIKIGISYLYIKLFPIKNEKSLEQFLINRFGNELYMTFFKDYTEKVWGTKCSEISAEWGAQRIKGLSITKAILHSIKKPFNRNHSLGQKNIETSLIEHFMYPKLGPGQMWEEVSRKIISKGGQIIMNAEVIQVNHEKEKIVSIVYKDENKKEIKISGDYYFSTMPIKELVLSMGSNVPKEILDISNGLVYRDFITVGLLLNKLKIQSKNEESTIIQDNWIYIQERDVKVGRLQIFNNWSPYMVSDQSKVWLGLEYFCNEGDELWSKIDSDFITFAIDELCKIEIIEKQDVIDSTILRVPKTYPAYFGTYNRFGEIRDYFENFENLFLVGRNGMHKYNNQDHSMLTAITAVENIKNGIKSKKNLWEINTEMDYHEKK